MCSLSSPQPSIEAADKPEIAPKPSLPEQAHAASVTATSEEPAPALPSVQPPVRAPAVAPASKPPTAAVSQADVTVTTPPQSPQRMRPLTDGADDVTASTTAPAVAVTSQQVSPGAGLKPSDAWKDTQVSGGSVVSCTWRFRAFDCLLNAE